MTKPTVLIVDDSAVIRQVLSDIINTNQSLELLGTASDPIFAMRIMEKQWPDVIILDIEMPRMDGLTFLRKLMAERPTPVIICSTLTEKGAQTTLQALADGAVDIVTKPKMGAKAFFREESERIVQAVKAASHAKVGALKSRTPPNAIKVKRKPLEKNSAAVMSREKSLDKTTECVVAVGTSTGGTQALETVLTELPRISPAMVIVQHMPEKFTAAFARRLNDICEIEVREAQNNDRVMPGRALIAPGGKHMSLKRSGANYYVEVADGPLVSRHRPSVDVLFRSVAKCAGSNSLGIIMTGMGDDGARGLKEMHDCGASTLAQDEASCVVYGMPKEAVKRGATNNIVPLDAISGEIGAYGRLD